MRRRSRSTPGLDTPYSLASLDAHSSMPTLATMSSWVANAMAHDTVPHTVGPEKRAMIQELTNAATTGRSESVRLQAKLCPTEDSWKDQELRPLIQEVCNYLSDPRCRLAVPELRHFGSAYTVLKHVVCFSDNPVRFGTDESVGADDDGDWTFRIVADRQTGNPESSCFFLDASRISKNDTTIAHELHEVQIAHGLHEADLALLRLQSDALDDRAGARVYRK